MVRRRRSFRETMSADLLELCVRRAYLDLNRTLHGFATHHSADDLRKHARQRVAELLRNLEKATVVVSQRDFDRWHEAACAKLQTLYHDHGFTDFSVGQAQKWLNMSLKYVFTLGQDRLPGLASLYQFAHIPLDNVFLQRAEESLNIPRPCYSWSRLNDYSTYLKYQEAVRDQCSGSAPLAVEFWLWLENPPAEEKS